MKKNLFKNLAFLFLVFLSFNSNAQKISNLSGVWHNELGSTLKITSVNASTGQIAGSYTLGTGETFPLSGWANEKLPSVGHHVIPVNFSVRYGHYGSVCAWSGYLTKIKNSSAFKIQTLWHLVASNANAEYNHITTNCDVFTAGPAPVKK